MYQKIILVGRVGGLHNQRMTQRGDKAQPFSLAVKRVMSKQDETDWFYVSTFRHTAEFVSNYIGKGDLVMVEGEMRFFKKDDGSNFAHVMANRVEICQRKQTNYDGDTRPTRDTEGARVTRDPDPSHRPDISMEEIPF